MKKKTFQVFIFFLSYKFDVKILNENWCLYIKHVGLPLHSHITEACLYLWLLWDDTAVFMLKAFGCSFFLLNDWFAFRGHILVLCWAYALWYTYASIAEKISMYFNNEQ